MLEKKRAINFSWRICLLAVFVVGLAQFADAQISLRKIVGNLERPVDIVHAGDGSGRLFIVLQSGRIVIYDGTKILSTPFLNIGTSIACCGERGLLSLAFHPRYKTKGYFYVHYTNRTGDLTVARYKVSSNPNVADPASRLILLTVPHSTHSNHNGGKLQFGPDGYLYISFGDGGGAGDTSNNAQNLGQLLGKILRIDVNNGSPYSVPSTNPFYSRTGARKEIWAYGLRNPWRISFDRLTGALYIADVGQGSWEEVSFQTASSTGGTNYGWRKMEGKHCFNPSSGCNDGTLKTPFVEYSHTQGCSVTGGYVYRGTRISAIYGTYLYADFCNGTIWGAKKVSGKWSISRLLSTPYNISTFGEDQPGEIYLAHYSDTAGAIYKIVR